MVSINFLTSCVRLRVHNWIYVNTHKCKIFGTDSNVYYPPKFYLVTLLPPAVNYNFY